MKFLKKQVFKHTCQPVPIDLFFKTVVIFLSYFTTVLLSMLQYIFHDHYAQNTKLIYKYTGNRRKFLLPVISYISNIMILCCMMIAHVINWCYVHFGMISNNSVICFLTVLVSCIHFIFYYYIYHVLALFDSIVNREKISQNLPVYVQMYYGFESNPTDYYF